MELQIHGAPIHSRTLAVTLVQRDDASWDARGQILDLRRRGLIPMGGDLQTAGVIHHMRVEAVLCTEPPTFGSVRAEQPAVAFEPSPGTGGECCRDPVRRIESLAGTPLDAAFTRRLSEAIGGPRGCSHVLTLTQLLASTASSALLAESARPGTSPPRREGERVFERNLTVDAVKTPEGGIQLGVQQADVHFAPSLPEAMPLDRLVLQRELRLQAEIAFPGMTLRALRGGSRETPAASPDAPGAPEWRDLDARVAPLVGRSALSGMARAVFETVGEAPGDAPLRDALLNLAPTVIQCMAALMEGSPRADGADPKTRGAMAVHGGMADSCYMWRRGGALSRSMPGGAMSAAGEPGAARHADGKPGASD